MARFTETDQAAQLLQQILAMPSTAGAPASSDDLGAWESLYGTDASESAPAVTPWASTAASAETAPPFTGFGAPVGDAVVREIVATRAGRVELTLRVTPQTTADACAGVDGETVGSFFRRVVRPISSADPLTL